MTYRAFAARLSVAACISLLIASAGIFLPSSAKAGILSDFFSAITKRAQATEADTTHGALSVQTLDLPRGAYNLDPNPSKGGGGITVVDDSAVASEEGPAGMLDDSSRSSQSHNISVYVVREGDTLSGIADMFDVTVSTIRWSNDLAPGEALQVGDTLTILPVAGVQHVVEEGDTLNSIAETYDGDLEEIESFNNVSAGTSLAVGDEIIIPEGEVSTVVHGESSSTPSQQRTTTQTTTTQQAPTPRYEGYYMRPISGGTRTQGIHGYNAVDLAASPGSQIFASAAGEVIVVRNSGWNGGYGNYTVIRHDNGTQTLYAHNASNIVSVGQQVVQGQVIGYVGSTGRSTGSHVHFEIRGATNPF